MKGKKSKNNKSIDKKKKNNNNNKRRIKKKLLFKKVLYSKFDYLIKKLRTYQTPNEYTRQDQDQKIAKYMKIKPVEYIA